MNDTFLHDTSGCAASANTVRGCSGSTVGPSGSHYIIGPLQKASGPRKKEKTGMSHFWDTHHSFRVPIASEVQFHLAPPALVQCVFDCATQGHFIVACFKFTFRSSFGVCHCKIGRNTVPPYLRPVVVSLLAPTQSRRAASKRCKGLQRRCLPTAPSNKPQKKNSSSAALVFVPSCENHIDLLSDGAHVILDDKPLIHRTASLFLRHPHKVFNQTSVFPTERPPLTRPYGRSQLHVEPHAAVCVPQRRSCLS